MKRPFLFMCTIAGFSLGAASKERFRDEKFVHARGFKGRFGTAGE